MRTDPLVTLPPELSGSAPDSGARYLLGVDGGATKTLAAVLDLEDRVLHVGHAGPSNEDAVGPEAAVAALHEAADEAIAAAGIERASLGAAVLAIAGTSTDSIAANLRNRRDDGWIVVNDVVGAWATVNAGGPAVAAIAGTGSNVFGVSADGRAWRTGGWGHLLGDEGSGYWLGNESIRAALRDRDGSGPPTRLGEVASAFFGVADIEAVVTLVYSKPLTKSEIAALAVETGKLAEEGDEVSKALYDHGAELLGGQIAAVIEHAGLTGSFPVGLIGSAYRAGEVFIAPLRRRVAASAPEARITRVEMAPVGGSLTLAARAAGRQAELDFGGLAQLIDGALGV
jgi:N-acetylglucosamine kinase-like BadF-type ATPase